MLPYKYALLLLSSDHVFNNLIELELHKRMANKFKWWFNSTGRKCSGCECCVKGQKVYVAKLVLRAVLDIRAKCFGN